MSRRMFASAALMVFALLCLPALPAGAQTDTTVEGTTDTTVPASGNSAQVDEGRTIFEDNCVPCHGEDLSGGVGLPLNAGSAAATMTDLALTEIITNGVQGTAMPAWGSTSAPTQLSDAQIAAVLSYIRAYEAGTYVPPSSGATQEESTTHFPWGMVFILSAAVLLSAGGIVMLVNPGQGTYTWKQAYARGFVIFFYFFLLTVWIPSTMFSEAPINGAPALVQDLVVSGEWFTMFAVGVVGLHFLQKARRV
jgi:mono/diheme cytochrome c family protein